FPYVHPRTHPRNSCRKQFLYAGTRATERVEEIEILKDVPSRHEGHIYFEYAIPRMGKRIDVLLIIGPAIVVIEFKVGEQEFTLAGTDQVWDYALDLKNFHETSHARLI